MAVAAADAAFDRFAPRQEGATNSASSTSLTQSPASSSSSTSASSDSNSIATTPTTTTSSPSSSASPFFPDPSTRVDPPNSNSDDSGLPKTVLEWIFLTLAILLVFALIIRRLNQLKIHSRPLNEFFSFRRHRISARRARSRRSSRHSRQSSSSSITSPYASPYITAERARSQIPRTHFLAPYPRIPPASYSASPSANAGYNIDLAGVPSSAQLSQLARHGSLALSPRTRTRTRAVNVDEGGRRLDSAPRAGDEDYGYGSSDGHGEKDDLPAYDKHGGPPGYVEVQFPGMITGVGAGGGRGTTTITAQEADGGGAGGMLRRLGMGPLGLWGDNNRNADVERDAERNTERHDDMESEESQLQHRASPSPSPPTSLTPTPAPPPALSMTLAGADTRVSEDDTGPDSTSTTTTTTVVSPPTGSAPRHQAELAHTNPAS